MESLEKMETRLESKSATTDDSAENAILFILILIVAVIALLICKPY